MDIRKPAVAGQFYPADEKQCKAEIAECIAENPLPNDITEPVCAAIVPHAGWTFSGAVAAMAINAVKQSNPDVDTFVIFGAVHCRFGSAAAVYKDGCWDTPLGKIEIDSRLAADILTKNSSATADKAVHKSEHSIEVQLPFIKYLFPQAKIVPILTAPADFAVHLGMDVGSIVNEQKNKNIVCIGSTDLTHYGPRYGFCPQGSSEKAIEWAKNVNDKTFIDLAVNMQAERIIAESMEKENACGPGAAAATIAAARAEGKTKGRLLAHTHSNDIMKRKFGQSSAESVGYASIIY